ncbi:hypothetical protein CH63R_02894 [Colletotrichum higginsianum IMI 349063]|uniref:Uncharacterized protein n=1 Tax=Colletotrichum higginsianum (strain IMI 349063) TaxID=759273 RepID=A0A1B7YQJ4_COLHI|nr:hypothetical protein CH63R_02894 [Colletotrichum higginsianum IMI 349063]OBR14168.1 hypothetical protein CH63R_02894 [Colletotrichum higginsianum IMI 349063]
MPHNTNLIDIRSAHWHKLVIPSATAASRAYVVLFFYYTDGDRTGAIGASSDWDLFFLFPFASTHELVCAKENRAKGIAPSFQRCQLHTQSVKSPSIANSILHREFSTAGLP